MIFRTTPIPALDVNNNTPAARIAWLVVSPVSSHKQQASSYKLWNLL
jgi:hypothetical protein